MEGELTAQDMREILQKRLEHEQANIQRDSVPYEAIREYIIRQRAEARVLADDDSGHFEVGAGMVVGVMNRILAEIEVLRRDGERKGWVDAIKWMRGKLDAEGAEIIHVSEERPK